MIRYELRGGKDIQIAMSELESSLRITAGDLITALSAQNKRILERTTKRFVDYTETPFAPYNETRPYYFYPYGKSNGKRGGRVLSKADQRRLRKDVKKTNAHNSGTGIRFASYAAFKRALGRGGVDLMGPYDPHMINSAQISIGGDTFSAMFNNNMSASEKAYPADNAYLTISGYRMGRLAFAHNEDDSGFNPKRKFFAFSSKDVDEVRELITKRMMERWNKAWR
jgi:hypothetical protein